MKRLFAGLASISVLMGISVLGVGPSFADEQNFDTQMQNMSSATNWTGFFVGASVGKSDGSLNADDPVHIPSANAYDLGDTLIGGQAGYRYQFDNNIVIGALFSLPLKSMNGSANSITTAGQTYEVEVDSAYLMNVMAGVAIGKWLPYATYLWCWQGQDDGPGFERRRCCRGDSIR